ncbi:MAG TPA: 3-deoxy-7-phosphoheptulonate synthase [Candidatus Dormibacteraeota bacterium]|nr:3-deoxy-7-phosphoheptulonate synthase [Candidatus Dormibacteraeota bacterium]
MIVGMNATASREQIEHVCRRIEGLGLQPSVIQFEPPVTIGAIGRVDYQTHQSILESLPGVESVVAISEPYKLVSRTLRKQLSVVRLGEGLAIGRGNFVMMAGPCAVESEEQILRIARSVQRAGARILRGGAYKPRSSPYTFQGLGKEGLRLLELARQETGLKIVTEVMSTEHLDAVCDTADILQIGARNMQNYFLLQCVGRARKPVLLKRGMSATLEELLLAAEYIAAEGTIDILLCERGIRTFETHTRNTLDLGGVARLREMTHLPIVVDPSQASGRRSLVPPLARAAVAAGADGLIIEVHHTPERALSDGAQSLTLEQFEQLMKSLGPYLAAENKTMDSPVAVGVGSQP